jgi:hypothetical protein
MNFWNSDYSEMAGLARTRMSVKFMGAQRKRRGSQGDGGIIFRLTEEIVSDSREHRRVRRGLRGL